MSDSLRSRLGAVGESDGRLGVRLVHGGLVLSLLTVAVLASGILVPEETLGIATLAGLSAVLLSAGMYFVGRATVRRTR